MNNGCIASQRILSRLDEFLNKNDYASAEKHLLYWIDEAQRCRDYAAELLIRNELMGLYRKLGRRDDALTAVKLALAIIEELEISEQVGAATTFLNCATVYKAFDNPDESLYLFEKAKKIYENELDKTDPRLGGLYNNMALTLVDLQRYNEAYELYNKAIDVMKSDANGSLEVAITYLNIANAKETQLGIINAEEEITSLLDNAKELLDNHSKRDGYYAFVCEKCSSVFGYFGYFLYENELKERARGIYEGA